MWYLRWWSTLPAVVVTCAFFARRICSSCFEELRQDAKTFLSGTQRERASAPPPGEMLASAANLICVARIGSERRLLTNEEREACWRYLRWVRELPVQVKERA
jgi:hypothetical protein